MCCFLIEYNKASLLVKVSLTLKSKRTLCVIYKLLSQWIKIDYDLFYKATLLRKFVESSEVKLIELIHYFMQESQCLSKHLIVTFVVQDKLLQGYYKSFLFNNLSRTKHRNLFLPAGQFRFVSTRTSQKIVETFGGNNIDTLKSWKAFLNYLNKQVLKYYVQKENGDFPRLDNPPISELLKQTEVLNKSYCFLVSIILKQNYNAGIDNSLSSSNIPRDIKEIQQLFIESRAVCLLTIQEIKNSSASVTPGIDNIAFSSWEKKKQEFIKRKIKNTRYFKSSKKFKVKKDLPKAVIMDKSVENSLRESVIIENSAFCWFLYKRCNVKKLRKNYRKNTIQRIWIPKLGVSNFRPLDILTLRDRVLETIIYKALSPISELQFDNFSFDFQQKYLAIKSVLMVANQLKALVNVSRSSKGMLKKVTYENYKNYKGLKYRIRSHLITKGVNKRRRMYSYTYWLKNKEIQSNKLHDNFYIYPRFINVNIEKCLEKIVHSLILKYTPITNNYRSFLRGLLYSPIRGTKNFYETKIVKIASKSSLIKGSIRSWLIHNFVLNGLEKFLLSHLPFRYPLDNKELNRIKKQSGQKKADSYKNYSNWPLTWLRVYRHVNNILVLGQASQEYFVSIYKHLILFLKDRGLSLKQKKKFIGIFSPEATFEFFGFQFQFAICKNSKITKGKDTRHSLVTQAKLLKGFQIERHRHSSFITICPQSYKLIMLKFKSLFARNKVGFSVETLIKDYNKWLVSVVTYFGLTRTTWIQLTKFNHLAYLKFKKLLLRKFSSKPKLKTFLYEKYFNLDYLLKDGVIIQLKAQNLFSHKIGPFHNFRAILSVFKPNIYLHSFLYIKNN